jgi:hypothetical protein
MAEHTPTPWFLLDQKLRPQFATRILEIQGPDRLAVVQWGGFDGLDRNQAKANAEFIVRCVNAHDELMVALERVQRALEAVDYWPTLKRDLADLTDRVRGQRS